MLAEEKIEEIKEFLKEKVKYIELGGSKALPFIHNPKDYDVIVICEDEKAIEEAKTLFKSQYDSKELAAEYKIDIHFRTVAQDEDIVGTIYPYILYFRRENYQKELKESELKQAIIARVSKFDKLRSACSKVSLYNSKLWYYVYITLCILENNSYELTENQIENVNILHDRNKSN